MAQPAFDEGITEAFHPGRRHNRVGQVKQGQRVVQFRTKTNYHGQPFPPNLPLESRTVGAVVRGRRIERDDELILLESSHQLDRLGIVLPRHHLHRRKQDLPARIKVKILLVRESCQFLLHLPQLRAGRRLGEKFFVHGVRQNVGFVPRHATQRELRRIVRGQRRPDHVRRVEVTQAAPERVVTLAGTITQRV